MSSPSQQPCRIVIVGRPNVGKSALFNRLIGRRRALVHDEPGVTRDRMEENVEWWVRAQPFAVTLVDTGGLGGDRFVDEIKKQVDIALSDADVVLFLFDGQTGLTPLDEELLRELNRSGVMSKTHVLAVVNKVDAEIHESKIADFFSVGLDPVLTVSAEHGRGMDDLKETIADLVGKSDKDSEENQDDEGLDHSETNHFEVDLEADMELSEQDSDNKTHGETHDKIHDGDDSGDSDVADLDVASLSDENTDEDADEDTEEPFVKKTPRIAIVGRPNVGKSTLLNALLGEDRMITSPIAGTTVDSVDSLVQLNNKNFILIDTAGMRRKSKTEQGIEVLSVVQARKALENADIALLVLDGEEGISDQDEKIGGLIEDAGCGVVLVMNKWDTQRKNPEFTKEMAAERIRAKMAYLKYAPILFVSALRDQGLENLGDLLEEILHQQRLKLPTHEFTEWVRKEITIHNPQNAKFFLCHQAGRRPPTFVCHVNDPERVHFSLRRHLVNALRDRWGYMGSPVRMLFVEGKNRRSLPRKQKATRKIVKESRQVG